MEEVDHIKYLGVIIPQNGSNMPDILSKRNKSFETIPLNVDSFITGPF